MSQNEGIALGHKYQRQTMNSQTQIRTALASVRDKQAAKVMKVERTEECETELIYFFLWEWEHDGVG